MKNIQLFSAETDYLSFINGADETFFPNVSYIQDGDKVMYQKEGIPQNIIFYINGIEQNDATSNMTWCEYAQMRREIDGWENIHCTEDDVTFDYVDGMVQLGVQYVTLNGERVKGDDIIQNGGQYTLEVVLWE